MALTAERLRELLHYDSLTGVFTQKTTYRGRTPGMVAGTKNALGYLVIRLDGRLYAAHRLAWMHVHGHWPAHVIDHINGVRDDNRIANLRDIPKQYNHQNMKTAPKNSTTVFLGVSYSARREHYIASIQSATGKACYLGSFPTPEKAHAAYLDAKRRMHAGNTL